MQFYEHLGKLKAANICKDACMYFLFKVVYAEPMVFNPCNTINNSAGNKDKKSKKDESEKAQLEKMNLSSRQLGSLNPAVSPAEDIKDLSSSWITLLLRAMPG